MNNMPKKGLYLALVIINCLLGFLWGVLSFGPYGKMKAAIAADDASTAWEYAGKIKRYALIGAAVNVIFFVVNISAML